MNNISMRDELAEQLRTWILPILDRAGLEMYDLVVKPQRRGCLVELIIDRPRGGITMEECADVNKTVVAHLDEENFVEGDYSLLVASPGVDWPLKTKRDFLRVIDRKVRFLTQSDSEKEEERVGIVHEVKDDEVVIESDGKPMNIFYHKIKEATQIV